MAEIDSLLVALAHPARRGALKLLTERGEMCLCEFIEQLHIPQPNMSRHMGMLRKAGLVTDRRDARWVRYRRNAALSADLDAIVNAVMNGTDVRPGQADDFTIPQEDAA
ncbi:MULTISPECIES: ArsR/SmtB family transcription factor [Alphaproteobacteria]|uniref:Transcriptional regulator n=2 Tax=Alphaproteobacteria TaxID=28211 RepID=A0A512HFX0_9HYPH|nr:MULTISPECIES: metalloregulator ArsR/SmtB family transcription factor [Alphaproteobacteria]GEO84346.1 transcriptional regulator [Ciceribacter naphthalenivorans]GLR24883.1 transcriptional regulator [Ciceribacter naphthalenivorans]GLT07739.1 transcriptional regulator [Sphingomonas psychrolutea]